MKAGLNLWFFSTLFSFSVPCSRIFPRVFSAAKMLWNGASLRLRPMTESHRSSGPAAHTHWWDLVKSKRQPREQFVQFLNESVFQFSRFYSKKPLQEWIVFDFSIFAETYWSWIEPFFCFMHHSVYFTVFLKTLADSVHLFVGNFYHSMFKRCL